MDAVARQDLTGELVPAWVLDAARARWDGWRRRRPDQAPGPGLVFEWALDGAGLRATYRMTVEVVAKLGPRTPCHMARVAERVGINAGHLRQRVVPALEAIGFLELERPPRCSHRPPIWTATVPMVRPDPELIPARFAAALIAHHAR